MAGYFEVISFLILPVFIFIILFNQKKEQESAAELYYVIFTPARGLPTSLAEAERANLISRFWRDSVSQGQKLSRFQQGNIRTKRIKFRDSSVLNVTLIFAEV